jgi:hypothetical protein
LALLPSELVEAFEEPVVLSMLSYWFKMTVNVEKGVAKLPNHASSSGLMLYESIVRLCQKTTQNEESIHLIHVSTMP